MKQGKGLHVPGATAEIGIGLAAVTFVAIALAPHHPVLVAVLVVTVGAVVAVVRRPVQRFPQKNQPGIRGQPRWRAV